MTAYTAFVRKDGDSCYGVDFPDFPGCVSAGDTIEEAITNAHEALSAHIAFMQSDNDLIPAPTSTEDALAAMDNEFGDFLLATMVRAPVKGKAVRITMTMDNNLLREVDTHAKAQGYSRSAFMAEACRRLMS
ncbi:MAG: type II toxin-antitoxin system HicB family antitoxin [Alphaproteobacteria bacterium]|nr:type II toxin-antitoxin system HicB family antitoxin [Alphaproteobacteria bacterium]